MMRKVNYVAIGGQKKMSKNDEQMDKQIVWHTHIQNAKSQLIELEKARVRSNENHNKTKEKIIRELAQALEDSGMPTGLISEEIVRALADEGYGVTKRYINMCLDKKYKTKLQNIEQKELGNGSENDNKNAPEQTILVDNTGYEEAFEDIDRPNVITESERVKKIEKRIDELAIENEILRRENKVLKEKEKEKEKTQPEHALELQEKFYDGSGLLDVKAMEKISEEAGRDIETMLKNTMVQYKSQ